MMILERVVKQQNRQDVVLQAPEHFSHDAVAERYAKMFDLLDWRQVPERDESLAQCGRLPHPEAAYVKAYLVMTEEKKTSQKDVRRYLLEHPALVWEIGFRLVADEQSVYGFDVGRSVPSERHLRRKLGELDSQNLTELLGQTVQHALDIMPDLGETISLDIKHIYANVKENNPREEVADRYDPKRQLRGDPDARLGVKRKHNQGDASHDPASKTEYIWGYGTGVSVAQTPDKDAIVLGDFTQPFNANDVTYAESLLAQAEQRLGFASLNLAADAAFDAIHLYQGPAERGGIAAIALNLRGNPPFYLGPNDYPLCGCNAQEMLPRSQWLENGQRFQRFRCTDCGKVRKMNIELGNLMRWRLDRQSPVYKAIYKQRTTTERINSQAKALGIERPQQRRIAPIARRNTLIYIVINIRAIFRHHERYINSDQPLKVA